MKKLIAAATLALAAACAQANVKLPAILSDNMCLQADKPVPIWGKADPGEEVTVAIDKQKQTATADQQGDWKVMLKAMPDGAGPLEMKVSGKNSLDVKNVIVGQVWIASGQSNMSFGFGRANSAAVERPKANYPKIRIFNVKRAVAFEPQWDCEGKWEECSPTTVDHTSAVGYFFARDIHNRLGVPVGLIHTSWGGTPAQAWTSLEGLQADASLQGLANQITAIKEHLPAAMENYQKKELPRWEAADHKWKATEGVQYNKQIKAWRAAVKEAQAAGKPIPAQPAPAHRPPRKPYAPNTNPNLPTVLYNAMIAPIIPLGIEGGIWYQGESNSGNPWQYRTLFPAMITDWRNRWTAANPAEKDFPFCFVQLANFMARQSEPVQSDGGWPGLREAQDMTLKLPNTGQAVIIDIGEATTIHPTDKKDVGRRLALAALKIAYHKDIVYTGPTYASLTIEGDKARVSFANIGGGLTIGAAPSTQPSVGAAEPASTVEGFSIAGADKKFYWAQARIEGNAVVVWSDKVAHPVAVRYAWANNPICNLYNKEGLPASPFRTDTWGGPPVRK